MQFVTDYRTERYVLDTLWEDLPQEVQSYARMCGVDLMCALVLGSRSRQFAAGQRLIQSLGGLPGDVPAVGSRSTYNLLGAAISMGHSSNAFDIDDGFRAICGHPGTSFVGGVLAAALSKDVTYREYLTTLTVCYEISIRWALTMQEHYQYLHSTGAYGAFGTAAGVGRLLGLDGAQLNNALSVADFHAPMTPVMRAVEYPSMNKDGVPFGVMTGVMAVLETLSGTTGRTHLLEMPAYAAQLDSLGSVYHIKDLYFKPYTCCRWAHQPILACQMLMQAHGFDHRRIASVTVHTFSAAARLSKIEPHSTDEAQYNIAFPVASALVFGDVGYEQVREEALSNPDVLSLMRRLSFVVDPALEAQFPARRLAWIEICLTDGTVHTSPVCEAPGEPEDPALGPDWIAAKFRRVTAPVLLTSAQDGLLNMLSEPGERPVREVVAAVNAALRLPAV